MWAGCAEQTVAVGQWVGTVRCPQQLTVCLELESDSVELDFESETFTFSSVAFGDATWTVHSLADGDDAVTFGATGAPQASGVPGGSFALTKTGRDALAGDMAVLRASGLCTCELEVQAAD